MLSMFRNRSFARYWLTTTFSMSASNIVQFVLALYVLDTTGSAALFAGMLSIVIVPRLLLTPLAGVGGDRWDKKRMMTGLLLVDTLVLGGFAAYHGAFAELSVAGVYALLIVLEVVETLYNGPANTVIPLVVKTEELTRANSLAFVNDAIVGVFAPVFAAFVYGSLGLLGGLVAAAVVELVALAICAGIALPVAGRADPDKAPPSMVAEFVAGIRLITRQDFLLKFMLFSPLINFFVTPVFTVTLIYVVRVQYGLSAEFYGASASIISLVGLLIPLAVLGRWKRLTLLQVMPASMAVLVVALGCILTGIYGQEAWRFGLLPALALIFVGTIVTIAISILFNVLGNALTGEIIPIEYMARTRSTMLLLGTLSIPLGQLLHGFLLDRCPSWVTVAVAAAGTLCCVALAARIRATHATTDQIRESIAAGAARADEELARIG